MDSFNKIKKYLISKQKEVVDKLRSLNQEEFLLSQATPETLEVGTFSWQADTTASRLAVKRQLTDFLEKIQLSLLRLNQGTYGKCDGCPRLIEQERLKIMPTTAYCISCKKVADSHTNSLYNLI